MQMCRPTSLQPPARRRPCSQGAGRCARRACSSLPSWQSRRCSATSVTAGRSSPPAPYQRGGRCGPLLRGAPFSSVWIPQVRRHLGRGATLKMASCRHLYHGHVGLVARFQPIIILPSAHPPPMLAGSMRGPRETVAKALALECMRAAKAQDRACYVFAFAGLQEVSMLDSACYVEMVGIGEVCIHRG